MVMVKPFLIKPLATRHGFIKLNRII